MLYHVKIEEQNFQLLFCYHELNTTGFKLGIQLEPRPVTGNSPISAGLLCLQLLG